MFIEDAASTVIAITEDRQIANEILHQLHAGGFSDAESLRHGDESLADADRDVNPDRPNRVDRGIRIKVSVKSRSERSCAISLVRDVGGDVEGLGPESIRQPLAMTMRAVAFGEG